MKLISLTQGLFAKVSDQDYARVSNIKWFAHRVGPRIYAGHWSWKAGKKILQHMHRFLSCPTGNQWVDHRDGDGLNNMRRNRRVCSPQNNFRGFRRKIHGASSRFRGVHWNTDRRKWVSSICLNGKTIALGRFIKELEAARAYDRAARKYFKSFACPNFK